MITLTPVAAQKILDTIANESHGHDPAKVGVRVYVKGGGCSGLEQGLVLDEPRENDLTFESNGVNIYVDPISYQYLKNAEIAYEQGLMNAGFKINNPNVKSTCGCGQSFEPKS